MARGSNLKSYTVTDMNSNIRSYRWVVWGLLVIIYLIGFFHRLSIGVITGELESSFGMNAFQIANLGAMYFYAYTLMQIPTGILADRLGSRLIVVSGTVIAGIASIMFSFSSSIAMAYASRLLVGIGVSVVFLATLKIVSNWFPAKDFASMTGLTSFMGNMGGIFAQAPLIFVMALVGWRGSFLVMGIATLVLAALVLVFVKNSPVDMGFPAVNPQPPQIHEERNVFYQLAEVVKKPKSLVPCNRLGRSKRRIFFCSPEPSGCHISCMLTVWKKLTHPISFPPCCLLRHLRMRLSGNFQIYLSEGSCRW